MFQLDSLAMLGSILHPAASKLDNLMHMKDMFASLSHHPHFDK